ncbi:hypothetical protein ACFL02_02455 [Planctomycetota bacterium]
MLKLITIGLIVWSFLHPLYASISFIVFFCIIEAYIILLNYIDKPTTKNTDELTEIEVEVLRKYHLYFRYPFVAMSLSSTLFYFQLSIIIFIPWLFYNHLWIPAVIIGLNYFSSAILSKILNPRKYLHHLVEKKGQESKKEEMLAVDSVIEYINELNIKAQENNFNPEYEFDEDDDDNDKNEEDLLF